jgi:uncharacterized protein
MSIVVTQLYRYPVKSCRGISLQSAEVDARGLVDDRRWMVVDARGDFRTQRELPRMALIETALQNGHLTLRAPQQMPLSVPVEANGAARTSVTVWRDSGVDALDLGEEAAEWLSDVLSEPVRLVHLAPDAVRQVDLNFAQPGDQVGFADGFPFLLISEESLDDLNRRLDSPLPMNRFRPNIVVRGLDDALSPFAEDTWATIRIGGPDGIRFEVVKPCGRCAITTTDQETAERGVEPLRTLATYRNIGWGSSPKFGQNLIHRGSGALRVGDPVEVLALHQG